MAQIFRPSADTYARLIMIAVVVGVAALVLLGPTAGWSNYQSKVGWGVEQPVPFSHKHHVAGLGLDCRFCHATVETSAHAGFPSTHVCMTCHSQIWTNAAMLEPVRESLVDNKPLHWVRVAKLPDYVFFRHDVHIAKGVGCVSCHGPIDKMPLTYRAKALTMEFCLDCHRDPTPHLRPPDKVTDMEWKPAGSPRALGEKIAAHAGIRFGELTHCYVCHR